MRVNYLFDIDGTLTPAREKMTSEFCYFFLNWMTGKNVYLVTGSDRKKVLQQIPSSILTRCEGVFSSMANVFDKSDGCVYENDWRPSAKLVRELTLIRAGSEYETKQETFIESRKGMINFTVAGRESTYRQRKKYNKWDQETGERLKIIKNLKSKYKRLEFRLGGQISIDIQPKGKNKSQASQWVRKYEGGKIIFFGDKCMEGGNDYDIVQDIKKNKKDEFFQVDNYLTTRKLLESYEA